MDAVALPIEWRASGTVQGIGDLHSAAHMANDVIADGHIRDLTKRADAGSCTILILWRQHDAKSRLRETTPGVLHNVALDQNALRVFQFEEIFDNKWIPIGSTHVPGLPFQPGQRLENVIVANLNIRWGGRGRGSAEHDTLPRSLKKIVHDLVRPHRNVTTATRNCLGIGANSGGRDAVKIRKERIHDRYVGSPEEADAPSCLVLGRAVHPNSIKYNFVSTDRRQIVDDPDSGSARDLQTNQAIVVGSRSKDNGTHSREIHHQ